MLLSTPRPPVPLFLVIPIVILLLAYLYSVFTRPELNPQAKVEDPGQFGWPEWYAQGGQIPYETSMGDKGISDGPQSVLLFIDLPYDSPSMPYALDVMRTLKQEANIDVAVVAPFSPAWRKDQSVKANLERAGCKDRILRLGDTVGDLEGACATSTLISEVMPLREADDPTTDIQTDPRANVTIMNQPHHLISPQTSYQHLSAEHGDSWQMGLFAHVLPSPGYLLPYSILYEPQSTYILPTSKDTFIAVPEAAMGPWLVDIPYGGGPPSRQGEDPLDEHSAYHAYWKVEQSRLANSMRRAGICIFEGWQEGLLDERIVQAMMSGCVVATVLPEVEHETLLPLILSLPKPVDNTSHVSLPVDELRTLLKSASTSDLKKKALHAYILAHRKFTPVLRTRAIFDAVRKWDQGGRGYLFPHGWRWTCDGAGEQPPWCT